MKQALKQLMFPILRGSTLTLICALLIAQVQFVSASGGSGSGGSSSTDVAGSTTGKTTSGGGGSGGGSKETGTTTTSSATNLTFTASTPVNGVVPVWAGTYALSPYYPTLYLMNVHVGVSSMNVPDGSLLYVTVTGNSGLITSGYMTITSQAGTILLSGFCLPSTTLTSVTISDSLGNVLATGK